MYQGKLWASSCLHVAGLSTVLFFHPTPAPNFDFISKFETADQLLVATEEIPGLNGGLGIVGPRLSAKAQ